jgi:Flp pilus assembly pilin Flp
MIKALERLCGKFRRLLREEGGQDLVEYGMLVTLIALLCISGMQGAADSVNGMFGEVSQALVSPNQQQQPEAPSHQHHGHDHGGHGWWH